MKEPPVPCPERSGPRAKDHCDYLLDSIDAQLNQLQTQGPSAEIKNCGDNEMASFTGLKANSSPTDLGECSVDRNVNASSEKDLVSLREEYTWRLAHLLVLEGTAENQSQSDSVCTEDFVDKFKEGLVDPLLNSDGEEDVSAGRILSCGFGTLECTARDQAKIVVPSQLLRDSETAADSNSISPTRQQPLEQLEGALSLSSGEPPSLVLQNRVRSLESLLGKISFCKESSKGTMNAKRGSSTWERILSPRPLGLEEELMGLEMRISGVTAIVEPRQRRDGLEDSLEQLQDMHQNSNSPLLIEDLSSVQGAAGRKTMLDAETSSRRVGQSCQEEGQCHCQSSLSNIASLCPIKAPHNSLLLVSNGEVRSSFISPLCLHPLVACGTCKRQRPTPSQLGTSTCLTDAPGDFQYGEGSVEQNRTTNVCTERHHEALELMAYGNLDAERCKPLYGLNFGCRDRHVAGVPVKSFDSVTVDSDLDSVRTESVQTHFCRAAAGYQQGHGTKKSHSLQEDVGRDLGSSDTEIEEEEKEESELPCQSGSHRRWTPRGKELSGWKRPKGGSYSSCKDLKWEEEKLLQKKSQIREADATLRKILQEKKHMALELEAFHKTLEESQQEAKRLELCLKKHHTKVEEARANLMFLEGKRDACLRELPELEKELSVLRQQCGQYGEISQLVTEQEQLKSQIHHQKLQLRNCKAEVATVQEVAGARMEKLREVARAASKLDKRTQQLESRILALQKILSEKELEMFRLQKAISALEAEKESWDSAMANLKQEHKQQVEKLQLEALQEKDRELIQLQEEKQKLLQEVTEKTELAKTKALQEQAAIFQKELDNLRKTLQDQDAELVQQQEVMQQQARKLKQDAEEMMQNSLLQERKKWEADTKVALQMQQETLEEQCRKMQAELQEALGKERRNCLALQVNTDVLQKRIQELETQARLLQGEKSTALEELRTLLQEEKAEALSQLRKELEQERVQEREQMRARIQQMDVDQKLLQAKERGASSTWRKENQTHTEQADVSLAREVTLVCQQLQDLLPKQAGTSRMLHRSSAFLSSSHALQALQEVSEATQRYLQGLKQETETLKHNILHIQQQKEQQSRQQQEQLCLESQLNLETLKDHMVQEHLKDIATLQRSWVEKSKGEMHELRKQLREKDEVLRAIQRNMARWKDKMASKLAHKFQAQLETELEPCLAKDKSTDIGRNQETTESKIRFPCTNPSEDPHSVGSLLLSASSVPSQRSFSTPKLLHHLRSQIQAQRAENTLHSRDSKEDLRGLGEDLTAHRNKKHLASDLSSPQLPRRSIRK